MKRRHTLMASAVALVLIAAFGVIVLTGGMSCNNPVTTDRGPSQASRTPQQAKTIIQGQTLPAPQTFVAFDAPPTPISLPAPIYPEMARNAGIEGMVILHILIDTTGKVRDVTVLKGVNSDLDKAAIEAARQSTWTPAFQNHKPVAVWVSFPVRFKSR